LWDKEASSASAPRTYDTVAPLNLSLWERWIWAAGPKTERANGLEGPASPFPNVKPSHFCSPSQSPSAPALPEGELRERVNSDLSPPFLKFILFNFPSLCYNLFCIRMGVCPMDLPNT
jgi:hypothetical protein